MTLILDDHLLRDLLSDEIGGGLADTLDEHQAATTNLWYLRLCKSAVSGRGGTLVGNWLPQQRLELGRLLLALPDQVQVVPLRDLAYRMAEIGAGFPVSALGAEVAAAAERLGADVCVWEGDDGPGIRAAVASTGQGYRTLSR